MTVNETVKYIMKKAVQLLLSLIVLSLIVFFVSRLAPGDPLRAYYGESVERMSQQQLQAAAASQQEQPHADGQKPRRTGRQRQQC